MPSISNLINDIADASIIGIGAMPPSNEKNIFETLSAQYRIDYASVHMKASLTPTYRLSCQSAVKSDDFNGNYLHFEDHKITIAEMDERRPIVASGNFSGCTYKVFKVGDRIICAHIARPAGPDTDELVTLMDEYAAQNNWKQLQEIETKGYIGINEYSEVFIVSQLKDRCIESIMMKLDNTGLSIGATNRKRTSIVNVKSQYP